METVYHNEANECPPGKHDFVPLVDNKANVGIVCQRCGKRIYERKFTPAHSFDKPLAVTESGGLV